MTRVVVVDGHPDHKVRRLIHALARAYAQGAKAAGHEVELITLSTLDFPLLREAEDFWHGQPPAVIAGCQRAVAEADHLVILFPLWLCSIPALTWGFIEQMIRPGFAFKHAPRGISKGLLQGRSARVVMTMGMPALLYRLFLRAHSLKTLRYVLHFAGFRPVRSTLFGSVEAVAARRREAWLERMRRLGREAR
jgi:putative NADPH-quinone reductase